ncbi:MAG: hypothetical protein WCV90_07330 [Candidatus Woesearchaeota archaeon]
MAEKEGKNGNGLTAYEFGKIGVTRSAHKTEVSLWLDSYGDIFSDFDSRPLSQRAMSQDFLDEARRATQDLISESFSFRLLMPDKLRNLNDEKTIRKRLKDHFQKHYKLLEKEQKGIVKRGAALSILGFILMVGAALISHYTLDGFWYTLLIIFCEPAGWFTLWWGLDHIFYFGKAKKPDYLFYERMNNHAEVNFGSY